MGTPTFIPQNDPHDTLIIWNTHNWGKQPISSGLTQTKWALGLGSPFSEPPPPILGPESPPPPPPRYGKQMCEHDSALVGKESGHTTNAKEEEIFSDMS